MIYKNSYISFISMLFTVFESMSSTKWTEDLIYDLYYNHAILSFVPAYFRLILKNSL